jgi:hypothetical protein
MLGAYGFRLIYPAWDGALNDLVDVGESAPAVTIEWRHACTSVDHDYADDERVSLGARGGSSFHVHREPPRIVFDIVARPEPDALVHPLGTAPLAALARWRGDVTLHAGAFATTAGAWMVAGKREAGKSTMLGMLAQRGQPIVADDMLAVLDGVAWAGPHCVDLRPDAAERLGPTRELGILGMRPRFRLSTTPAPAATPLRGLFLLDWGDDPRVTVEPLEISERIRWLYSLEYLGLMGAADPRKLLELAALPSWRIARPRDWMASEDAADAILATAETHS